MHQLQSSDNTGKPIRVGLTLEPDLARGVDEWRRRQARIPSLSESLKRLVTRALETEHARV